MKGTGKRGAESRRTAMKGIGAKGSKMKMENRRVDGFRIKKPGLKQLKRLASLVLAAVLAFQISGVSKVLAAVFPPMVPPRPIRVEARAAGEPAIGYKEGIGYYVDLKWDDWTAQDNVPVEAEEIFRHFYVQEVMKYGQGSGFQKTVHNLSRSTLDMRLSYLKSGTIYNIYQTANYTAESDTYTSPESQRSNILKIMTDIDIAAEPYEPNRIKIVWDDVWDYNGRINYKLYISQNSDFANVEPIYIRQGNIGPNGPVVPDTSRGKLEYIYNVPYAGTVYYIKIVPDISDPSIKRSPESPTVLVSSFILATTEKMSVTNNSTIWKLTWTPVITDLNSTQIEVAYKIYKGKIGSNNLPEHVATVTNNTSYFAVVPNGETNVYYRIVADVRWLHSGGEVYPVPIQSDDIILRESEIPSTPAAPELQDAFREKDVNGTYIISYNDVYDENGQLIHKGELRPDSATVMWRVPRKANGEVDTDIVYDIWLITDPNTVNSPPVSTKIASDLKMGTANEIREKALGGTKLVGYKYKVNGLSPNSTYYFRIIAKKTFLVDVDGTLTNVAYHSQSALKIIITPTDGPIDQPLVPARPPFRIKQVKAGTDEQGNDVLQYLVTDTTAVIQLKNMWYEYLTEDNTWKYFDFPEEHTEGMVYRKVEYDPGVTISVGCVEYFEGMDISVLPTDKLIGVPSTTPSLPYNENRPYNPDPLEDPAENIDGKKHNIDIKLTGLQPNTTYIIWLRAERTAAGKVSGISDPIIITTDPVMPPVVEKPTVPAINYTWAGDDFVDLGWEFKNEYTYYIRYGTVDNLNQAMGELAVTQEDYTSYFRVKGLTPNTIYYFWIRAEATNGTLTARSDWSDSYPVKTLPLAPPPTPRGFGIKNTPDAVTKNSLTFEWIQESGMKYILEIASDIDYRDMMVFEAGAVSEITVDGLRSNRRYFARLYAYDPAKDLVSKPTQSITVRTKRSDDEYDSDEDTDHVIGGDFIEYGTAPVSGEWSIRITGVNADRFAEHVMNDRVLDFVIDATTPPKGTGAVVLTISSKVFKVLDGIKENISIDTQYGRITIRPGTLGLEPFGRGYDYSKGFDYRLKIAAVPSDIADRRSNISFRTSVMDIRLEAELGGMTVPITSLGKPLLISFFYSGNHWYTEGETAGYLLDDKSGLWERVKTSNAFDSLSGKGKVSFEMAALGKAVVADKDRYFYDDISGHKYEMAVIRISSAYELKSVSGRRFRPDAEAALSEAVKLMFDVLEYDYSGRNIMEDAVKSRLIIQGVPSNPQDICTREIALAMAVRVYELKTGDRAVHSGALSGIYADEAAVTAAIRPRVSFAIENGLASIYTGRNLSPARAVTRGEIAGILEKVLALAGELD